MKKTYKLKTTRNIFFYSIFLLSAILTFSISVDAYENYTVIGGYDDNFLLGDGYFNENLDDEEQIVVPLSAGEQLPYVVDMDEDGTNEIIVIDGTSFKAFHKSGSSLSPLFSETIQYNGFEDISPLIFDDISGDGNPDLIYIVHGDNPSGNAKNITPRYVSWNGTHATTSQLCLQANFTDSNTYHYRMGFNCREGVCFGLGERYTNLGGGIAGQDYIRYGFNLTHCVGFEKESWANDNLYNHDVCILPAYPPVYSHTIGNYDYYAQTGFSTDVGTKDWGVLYLSSINRNTANPARQWVNEEDLGGGSLGYADFHNDSFYRNLTGALRMDIEGFGDNEYAYGIIDDTNSYRIVSVNADGSNLDTYDGGEGIILGNIFQANVFPNENTPSSFCVSAFDDNADNFQIHCANEQSSYFIGDEIEFDFDYSGMYDINIDSERYNGVVHASNQMTNIPAGTTDLDEFVTSFGVFKISKSLLGIDYYLERIWSNPVERGASIMCDVEKTGREDYLILKQSNLYYIDDGYSFSGCNSSSMGCINYTSTTFNPCVDAVLKLNTTLGVNVYADDILDGQDVSVRVVAYHGETYAQDSGWSANYSSGTIIPFSFVMNVTDAVAVLRIMVRDVYDPSSVQVYDQRFGVSAVGVEYGDTSCSLNALGGTYDDEDSTSAGADVERTAREVLRPLFGTQSDDDTNDSLIVFGLLLLIPVAILGTMINKGVRDSYALIGVPAGVTLILWIFLVMIGMVSAWTVIFAIIISSAGLSVNWWFKNKSQVVS